MLRITLLLLLVLPFISQADIFKHKDSQGNIIFSDKPSPNAKKIKLPATPEKFKELLKCGKT